MMMMMMMVYRDLQDKPPLWREMKDKKSQEYLIATSFIYFFRFILHLAIFNNICIHRVWACQTWLLKVTSAWLTYYEVHRTLDGMVAVWKITNVRLVHILLILFLLIIAKHKCYGLAISSWIGFFFNKTDIDIDISVNFYQFKISDKFGSIYYFFGTAWIFSPEVFEFSGTRLPEKFMASTFHCRSYCIIS